ncbi:MAG: RluA family pseudouridine synthase [Planctomycetes bacterium]|nr:RluA family pseudouridine synthase [Planctomycetota bacterium]
MSQAQQQVIVVEPGLGGVRLYDLLAAHHPDAHHADLRQLVAAGDVSVNGEACLANRRLRNGDVVLVGGRLPQRRAAPKAASAAAPLAVLFESASAVVVAKPAGLATVPERVGRTDSVHARLAGLRPGADLRIVHRLDRDTSGALLLAKGIEAARWFDAAFRGHDVHKTYLALVDGVPAADAFAIDLWLGPDRSRPGKVVAADRERRGFRAAHTDVSVRQRFARHALLELHPRTGRGHQLRVHLQASGHAIVGDRDYGGGALLLSQLKPDYKRRPGVDEVPLLQRMFLHAARIAFRDLDGNDVVVEAPLPEDLAVALRHIEKHDDKRQNGR